MILERVLRPLLLLLGPALVAVAAARQEEDVRPLDGRVVEGPVTFVSDTTVPLRSLCERWIVPGSPPGRSLGFRAQAFELVLDPLASQSRVKGIVAEAIAGHPFVSAYATGLEARAETRTANVGFPTGIHAMASGGNETVESVGVLGEATDGYTNYGLRGRATGANSLNWGVFCDGDMGASGSKSFVQPHPSDPALQLQLVALEGNENGTYFRGTATLLGGVASIVPPEAWRLASELEGVTVQLTALGPADRLWVEERGRERIVVRGEPDVSFDYVVNGVRRGFAGHEAIRPNSVFRPHVRGVPFGEGHPPAMRAMLVENGLLRPDFTPNEATTDALGWTLDDPPSAKRARASDSPLEVSTAAAPRGR